jgi:hypothetical protein
MEDYYKLLNLKPQSSNYRIAKKYKEKMRELLDSGSSSDVQDSMLKISRAYSVLGNEAGRKYYDMLYGSEISGKGIKLYEGTIRKYSEIVDMLSDEGAEIVKNHLDEEDGTYIDLMEPLISLYLLKGLAHSIGGGNIAFTGLGAILYSILGIYFFIKFVLFHNVGNLIGSLFLCLIGFTVLIVSYRGFAVSEIREILKN